MKRAPEELIELIQVFAGHHSPPVDSPTEASNTEAYPEIDKLFTLRKLEAAEYEINKLPDPEQDTTLGQRQRYALLRLRAKLAAEQLNFDETARLFMLAHATCPTLSSLNRIEYSHLSCLANERWRLPRLNGYFVMGYARHFLSACLSGLQVPPPILPPTRQQ